MFGASPVRLPGRHSFYVLQKHQSHHEARKMRFPIPFLPMLVVAVLISTIIPAFLRMCRPDERDERNRVPSPLKETSRTDLSSADPVSDPPDVAGASSTTDQVQIEVEFVECGSRTEELSFDWIEPFEQAARGE